MTRKIIVVAAVLLISACSSVKLMTPTEVDVQRGTEKFPGLALPSLLEGKSIFEKNCAKCHGLKDPMKRDEEKWKNVVPRMVKKVNKKAGKEEIGPMEQQVLLQYLVTMSTAKKPNK